MLLAHVCSLFVAVNVFYILDSSFTHSPVATSHTTGPPHTKKKVEEEEQSKTRNAPARPRRRPRQQATKAVLSAASLAKPAAGLAGSGLGFLKRRATAMVSSRDGAAKTAAVVIGGAVGAYLLWPAAVVPAAATAGATMKAPGAAGFFISRAAFVANPQLYFQILRTGGAAAAAAAFGVPPLPL